MFDLTDYSPMLEAERDEQIEAALAEDRDRTVVAEEEQIDAGLLEYEIKDMLGMMS